MSRNIPEASRDASAHAAAPSGAADAPPHTSPASPPPAPRTSVVRSAAAFYRRDPAVASLCVSCGILPIMAVVPQRLKGPLAVVSLVFLALGAVLMLVHRRRRTDDDA